MKVRAAGKLLDRTEFASRKRVSPTMSSYKRLDQLLVGLFGQVGPILVGGGGPEGRVTPGNVHDRIHQDQFPAWYRLRSFSRLIHSEEQLYPAFMTVMHGCRS